MVMIQKLGMVSGVGIRAVRITLPQTIPLRASFSHHLNFNVDKPTSTSIMVMIQKRTTTWFSFQPFNS
jgi:hypothetical protein